MFEGDFADTCIQMGSDGNGTNIVKIAGAKLGSAVSVFFLVVKDIYRVEKSRIRFQKQNCDLTMVPKNFSP